MRDCHLRTLHSIAFDFLYDRPQVLTYSFFPCCDHDRRPHLHCYYSHQTFWLCGRCSILRRKTREQVPDDATKTSREQKTMLHIFNGSACGPVGNFSWICQSWRVWIHWRRVETERLVMRIQERGIQPIGQHTYFLTSSCSCAHCLLSHSSTGLASWELT